MAGRRPEKKAVVRSDFAALLADVKTRIQSSQARAVLAVNAELVRLYWDIGRIIDARQQREGWGATVIPRLAKELKNELPELKGFSERNIKSMLAFYREYCDPSAIVQQAVAQLPLKPILPQPVAKLGAVEIVPRPVAQLPDSLLWSIPWGHHVLLMLKVKDLPLRRWYMEQTLANGWSRNVLAFQIDARAHARHGKAVSNFAAVLPAPQSDLAQQTLKDPYIFDFLYGNVVNDRLTHPTDQPTVGLILCQEHDRLLAEYSHPCQGRLTAWATPRALGRVQADATERPHAGLRSLPARGVAHAVKRRRDKNLAPLQGWLDPPYQTDESSRPVTPVATAVSGTVWRTA
jgi:predicted nuclease of restriction endonuclease-like (RecB) superfamily